MTTVLKNAYIEACTQQGYINTADSQLNNACVSGAQHKGDPTYCNTQYFVPSLADACVAGQKQSPVAIDPVTAKPVDDAPDCNPDLGIGWLLCPTVKFLAGIGDTAKGFIDDAMVVNTSQVLPIGASENSAYSAWTTMRNIANVLFIIAFLFMIYSQITGFGLSNYSLKKMLPRLIVAAILINASYYICVAGVEISNVLGQGLDHLVSAGNCGSADTKCIKVALPHNNIWSDVGQGLVGLATAALAIGILGYFFLPQVIAVVIYVAFVAMAAAVLLGVRQALIILLVIVSPIAFAAYLLPNTDVVFKKWWGIFKALLLLYPIFGLLYGAGKLAAGILGSTGNWELQIFGYVALFSGLLLLPKLLEGALAVGGISSIVSKFQGKATGAATNKAKQAYDNSNFGNFRKYRQTKAGQRNQLIRSGQYKGSNRNPLNWVRNARSKVAGATLPIYGSGYQADVQQRGAELADKLWEQKVGNQQKYMSLQSMGSDDLMKIIANKDGKSTAESRAAAAGMIMKNGSMKEIQNLFDETQKLKDDDSATSGIRKQMMHDMNRTPFGLGSFDQSNMRRGLAPTKTIKTTDPVTGKEVETAVPKNYDESIIARAENKLSDAAWNNLDPDDKIKLHDLADKPVAEGGLSNEALQNLVNATYTAENNSNISVTDETRRWGEEIRQYAAAKGIRVQTARTPATTTGEEPATQSRNGGPEIHLRGGETTTDSGFIVPHDMK